MTSRSTIRLDLHAGVTHRHRGLHLFQPLELQLQNKLTEIPRVHDLLDEFSARHGIAPSPIADLHVALEEHLSNLIRHGYLSGHHGNIAVRFERLDRAVRVEVEDDGRPFNPLLGPPVDVNQPLDHRPIGGLGLHLIQKLTDDLRYERRSDRNVLVMVKSTAAQ